VDSDYVLDKPIGILRLRARVRNALDDMKCTTVRDVVIHKTCDFLRQRNFGETSLQDLLSALAEYDLYLGMNEEALPELMSRGRRRDRLELAGKAMQAMITGEKNIATCEERSVIEIVYFAFRYADAMLTEADKERQ